MGRKNKYATDAERRQACADGARKRWDALTAEARTEETTRAARKRWDGATDEQRAAWLAAMSAGRTKAGTLPNEVLS